MNTKIRSAILVVLFLSIVFAPSTGQTAHAFGTDDEGHERIVRNALRPIVATLPDVEPLKFTEAAIEEIVDANEDEDLHQFTSEIHFDNESFSESTERLNNLRDEIMGLLRIDSPNGQDARHKLGEALHTLQDFYAHSNWVEVKEIHSISLPEPTGKNSIQASPTIRFCPDEDFILNTNLTVLTSGYFDLYDPLGLLVPSGKCHHGIDFGPLNVRGIAKDTEWLSSLYHMKAKEHAIRATKDFVEGIINDIKDDAAVKNKAKALRALMGASAPLIFVIDDSGSMGAEISGVKSEVAKLVADAAKRDYPPQQFILVRFNDPQVSPAYSTPDPQQFLQAINAIAVGDGGDCPELYYKAMRTAINASPAGSEIYSFTDASAKDDADSGNVIALAQGKEIVGDVTKTGTCSGTASAEMAESEMAKQETPPSQSERMQNSNGGFVKYGNDGAMFDPASAATAEASDSSFARLARETGGTLFSVSPGDVSKVFDVIRTRVLSDTTPMIIRSGNLASAPVEIAIPVDSSISVASIIVTVDGSARTLVLKDPSGITVTVSTPNVTIQNLGANRIFTLNAPSAGVWKMQLGGSGAFVLKASASSGIQFNNFEFVESANLPHVEQQKIPGQPVTGAAYQVRARVFGDAPSPTFQLVGDDGSVLQTLSLAPVALSGTFSGTFIPPAQPFRVQVSGLNAANQQYQRLFPTLYSVKSVGVRLDMASYIKTLATAKVLSGQTIPMNFAVENLGPAGTFSITATASDAQILAVKPPSLTLASGLSQTVVVTVGIAPTRVDKEIAVSVVAANVADSSVYNTSVVNLFVPGANLMQIPMVSKPAEPVPFNWLEATTGGRVVAAGDDTYERVDLPFPFTYFGQSYSQIFVASNGFITFGAGANSRYPVCAPSRNWPNNAVYAFWSDLIPTGGANGNVYVRQVDPQTVVVQWNRVKHYFRQTLQTFQIILRADSSITLQYKSVDPSAQGVVGFEDSLGLTGSSIVCPGRNASPANNSAYRFAVR